jgi:aminopeptidase YwaD
MQRSVYFLLISLIHFNLFSQVWNRELSDILDDLEAPSPLLFQFQDLGVKSKNSNQNLENTAFWLSDYYAQLNEFQIYYDSFLNQSIWNKNVILERKVNNTKPWIVIGAHYDTRGGPGCNDNGSGVVTCMRIAKLIVKHQVDVNLRIIHFAGEEDGLVGSKHYVRNTLSPEDDILFMFNLDQLGGTRNDPVRNAKIICEYDDMMTQIENNIPSQKLTDTLFNLTKLYTGLNPEKSYAYASDYVPFENAGYVITGLYQFEGIQYPGYHNSLDVVAQMDTIALKEVMRSAAALILHHGGYRKLISIEKIEVGPKPQIVVYPNPSKNVFYIKNENSENLELRILKGDGKLIYKDKIDAHTELMIDMLTPGFYLIQFTNKSGLPLVTKRLIIAQDF